MTARCACIGSYVCLWHYDQMDAAGRKAAAEHRGVRRIGYDKHTRTKTPRRQAGTGASRG